MEAEWLAFGIQLLLWGGLLLLLYALFADALRQRVPSRRRRRCPKCWYDLSHAPPPGLRCSECGFEAARERSLFKARRHWRLAIFALVAIIAGHGCNVASDVRARGWVAAVPATVLIAGLPLWEPYLSDALFPPPAPMNESEPPSWLHKHRTALLRELTERIAGESLPSWQRWMAFHYALRTTRWNGLWPGHAAPEELSPIDASAVVLITIAKSWRGDRLVRDLDLAQAYWDRYFEHFIQYRTVWPEGVPYSVRIRGSKPFQTRSYAPDSGRPYHVRHVRMASARPGAEQDLHAPLFFVCDTGRGPCHWGEGGTVVIGMIDPDQETVELTFQVVRREQTWGNATGDPVDREEKILWSRHLSVPVELVASPQEAITPYSSGAFDEFIRDSLRPAEGPHSAPLRVTLSGNLDFQNPDATFAAWPDDLALGVVIEVCDGDEVVLSNAAWSSRTHPGLVRYERLDLDGDRDRFNTRATDEGWFVRVRSDPALALRAMEPTRYWDGEVVLPLEEFLLRR